MVGLERVIDHWGYTVEPLMPDRPKVRDQTKRERGLRRVREVQVHFRDNETYVTSYLEGSKVIIFIL